jgi:hypothetical protein
MKIGKNIMSKAGVLLIAAIFIASSSAVMADTEEKTSLVSAETSPIIGNLPRDEEEIKYYNPDTLTHVIGLSGGTPPYYWYSAIRFSQDELAPYAGWDLTKVNVALSCDNGQLEVWAKLTVWGEGTENYPGSIIYEDDTLYFDATGFHIIELSTPIPLDDHDEIWIGIEWEQTEEGAFIPFTDDGPAVDKKGCWVSQNGGGTWNQLSEYALDYNWGMGGIVSGEGLAELAIKNVAGPIGVNADIENIGDTDATNVEWTMTVTGGILGMVNKTVTGTATSLAAGAIEAIGSGIVLGFGSIDIEITASADNANEVTVSKSGFVLGILVIGL